MASDSFLSEEDLVHWLQQLAPAIGDDAAFIGPLGDTAVTVDSQREGVHFLPGTPPAVIARRLLAVSLSDLAATGAKPHHALCTLAAPEDFDRKQFFEELVKACSRYKLELVGGDLATASSIECTLTAVGTRLPRGRFLRRASARVGDDLWLAGSIGESALGLQLLIAGATISERTARGTQRSNLRLPSRVPRRLRPYALHCLRKHREPTPLIELGNNLARLRCPIAAIDVSDGLLKDARRLARCSGVGLRLDVPAVASTVPAPAFNDLCEALAQDPGELQLAGGEDYALAFSTPKERSAQVRSLASAAVPITRIGTAVSIEQGLAFVDRDQERSFDSLADHGWDHLTPNRKAEKS